MGHFATISWALVERKNMCRFYSFFIYDMYFILSLFLEGL
nr:MAG TPA: hypothetical protein [Caudoviricetes sp.]